MCRTRDVSHKDSPMWDVLTIVQDCELGTIRMDWERAKGIDPQTS